MDVGTTVVMMFPGAVPGVDFLITENIDEQENPTREITVWKEEKLGPRPANYAALQSWAEANSLEALRTQRKKELERSFQDVWDAQFGTQIAVGLTIYFDFPNDARTVAVKNAKANFLTKTNALNDLGRPGKPALTEANIMAIVW